MKNTSVEEIGCFKTILDPYNGLTIDAENLPDDIGEFEVNLDFLIQETINHRFLIWIYVPIEKSNFIQIATKKEFFFHSCGEDYILLVRRLKPNAIVPTAANHTLGVGVVVINEKNELLVIKERISTVGYKLPGGHIDDAEMISTAAVREVYEETGVKVEFESVISLGHFYPHQFHKSNLYILSCAKPLTNEINIKDTDEIEDAKWVDVNEYLTDDGVIPYSKTIVKAALSNYKLIRKNEEVLNKVNRTFELFFPHNS